ncbi:MAG: alpha/beta fold hydrolase [Burkholderiales bacterium]
MKDVVLLHGWGMSSSAFEPLARALGGHCEAHALDLPGYGGSQPCDPYTLDALVTRIAGLAPRRCVAVGWSLGALVALAWARALPKQVGALVLIGATPCFVQKADWLCAVGAQVLRSFGDALESDRSRTLRRFVALQANGDEHKLEVMRLLNAAHAAAPAPSDTVLQAGLGVLLQTDLRPLLPSISQRALVIHGERDALVPVAAGTYLATTMSDATLEIVAGAAHAPFAAHAGRIAESILGCLR